jgi:hypothetical protein
MKFGNEGGLYEINYAGFGFILTKRIVFETIQKQLKLCECNQKFGLPVVPYFLSMIIPDGDGTWFLPEDYSFCERAKQCGFRIFADTSIALEHLGSKGWSFVDVGNSNQTNRTGS